MRVVRQPGAAAGTGRELCNRQTREMAPNPSCETVARVLGEKPGFTTAIWCQIVFGRFTQIGFGAARPPGPLHNGDSVPRGLRVFSTTQRTARRVGGGLRNPAREGGGQDPDFATRFGARWTRSALCDTVLLSQRDPIATDEVYTCGDTKRSPGIIPKVSHKVRVLSTQAQFESQSPDFVHRTAPAGSTRSHRTPPRGHPHGRRTPLRYSATACVSAGFSPAG